MRAAAVDIGTNTVRALVSDEAGHLDRFEFLTGLGIGVDANGRLSEDAIDRTVDALEQSWARIGEAPLLRMVATSASRDAENREAFFDRIEEVAGRRPELLSGEEEAALSFAGAIARRPSGLSTVIDLGGGSTEIVAGVDQPVFAKSFDIGSVRITDRFFEVRPVAPDQLTRARDAIVSAVSELPSRVGTLIGVGGTFQTLGRMLGGSNHDVVLDRPRLDDLVSTLAGLSLDATGELPGVSPGREVVILGGALVASTIMTLLGADEVLISCHDLLDGMLALLLAQSHPTDVRHRGGSEPTGPRWRNW